jgi:AraC-like DNA-binding protein
MNASRRRGSILRTGSPVSRVRARPRRTDRGPGIATVPCLAVFAPRDRVRSLVRTAFPRRQARLIVARTAEEFAASFRVGLIDAALIDLAAGTDDVWTAVACAREFPSAPFFGVSPLRSADGPALARAASLDLADVIIEGVDDAVVRAMVFPVTFRARFAAALREPPPALALSTTLQRKTWQCVINHAGLPVRTDTVARVVGVTREHLSRAFVTARSPNLKRVIDLVRLVAAAELAKNPGYDLRDVAGVLGFASASHLSSTTQRIVGLRPPSLARLRAIDLIGRFVVGRGRSRKRPTAAREDKAEGRKGE